MREIREREISREISDIGERERHERERYWREIRDIGERR